MEIVDVEIASSEPTHVTPLELIEDFADVMPDWHFLEDDSRLLAAIRGREACVIRGCNVADKGMVDFAFVMGLHGESEALRLTVLCPPDAANALTGIQRSDCLQHFLDAFESYLHARKSIGRIRLSTIESHEEISA